MTEGTKDDMGKLQWDLIDYDFIEECVKVMQQGMKKYGYENWKKELDPRRIKNALLRHYMEYHRGKKIDNESGFSHLSHIFCNTMFLYHYDHLKKVERDEIENRF